MLELLASDYRPIAQDILAYSLCLIAFIWGAGPERVIATTWLVLFEFSYLIYDYFWRDSLQLTQIDTFLAFTDVAAGFAFLAIALNANRNYPLFIAAMQLLAISSHLSRGLIESISPIAYIVMALAPGWLQLIIFAAGLTRHIQRKRRYGTYRSWRKPIKWPSFFLNKSSEFGR